MSILKCIRSTVKVPCRTGCAVIVFSPAGYIPLSKGKNTHISTKIRSVGNFVNACRSYEPKKKIRKKLCFNKSRIKSKQTKCNVYRGVHDCSKSCAFTQHSILIFTHLYGISFWNCDSIHLSTYTTTLQNVSQVIIENYLRYKQGIKLQEYLQ